MVRSFLLISLTIVLQVSALDECISPTILGDLAKRSPNYIQDAVPLCDRYLVEKWYVAVQHKMPTIVPDLGSCGTTYPVWLNGDLPVSQGELKVVQLCQVGFGDPCSRSYSISVKNCGTFFVYRLIPLDICQSAYCFEKTETCVNSVPSNLAVAYHGVTWDTNIDGLETVHDPDINLVCQFDRLPDQSLYYDVTWYVDDTEVLTNQTVSSNSSDLALLTGSQMLAKGKQANSMVHCIVGAKLSATDIPCNTSSSPLFFAGIKVLTPTLRMVRGRSADVNIQFTIPFINQHGILRLPSGAVLVDAQPPLLINMAVHGDSVDCNDPNKNLCEKKVYAYKREDSDKYNTDDWKGVHSIKVYNKDDGDYTIDKHITLRLETGGTSGTGSKIFDSIILPDIQVFIEDTNPSWKGAYCGSHTDPHMKTFDGKYYECQLDGTFILYRNSHFNQEVQEKHHLCYPAYSYPRCSCAVAVRSGKDVFMVDICNSKSIIHFPSCGDRVLKVIKTNDRYYKVFLPTGTLVEIKFVSWPRQDNWQLNVDIFPSPSDVGNSSGLCGVLDGDYKNDFTRSDGTVDDPDHYHYSNPPNEFSESWRVTENELDLFDHDSYHDLPSISEKMDLVCTCKKHSSTAGDIECNYGTYKNCKFVVGKPFHCILNPEGQLRRKRDLRHLETMLTNSQIENKPYQENRQKREVAPTVKTYEVAEEICSTAFQASTSYLTCQNYVTHLSNTSLINCISDVMMTGDDNFTRIHIEAALEQCSVFVVLNKTFQQTEPEVAYTIEAFCQNNCSGHGICNAGNCTCNEGYAGSDCSFDLLGPPTISHISDFGFCDKSKEACDEITLFGKYFIENMNTNCFMTRHTLQEDGSSVSMAEYMVGLEERTMFEGYCPLDYDTTNHWVTEYSFNISNDGSRFTDNFHVYTYQSLCQEYRNDTGNITFIFKNGYCFINNSCVGDGSTNTINKCDICNTTKSKYDWSYNEGHCYISGICYKSGDFDGNNPCSICDPSVDKTAWSPNTDLCFIDDICYGDGQTQVNTDCQVCRANISRSNWTLKIGHCLIDGVCYNTNDADNTNPCSVCDPFLSTSEWSTNIRCVSTIDGGLTTTTPKPTTTATIKASTTITEIITTPEPTTTTTQKPTTTTQKQTTTTTEPTTVTSESSTTTPEPTTTTPEPTTTSPEPTTTSPEPTTTTPEPTTTTPEPTTTTPEPTTTTPEPTTTTPEPTTTTPEPTTTTPEPTTTTPEPTTTTPEPTTTTPEPTTTTPEPTTTTPEPTTTTPEPTTTTPKPTTTTPEPTTTTPKPTTSTQEPTTTTPELTTSTPEPTTTTPEPTTTTPEPTTSTPEPTTTTPEPTTTTPEPTTTTPEPTTTTSEPTTTPEPTTTTSEPTTTTPEPTTTTTPEPTTTTPEPTTTTPEPTTTTPEPTTTTPEPTTTTPEPTTTTPEPTTTTPEPTTTTSEPTTTTSEPTTTTPEPTTTTPEPTTTTPEPTTTTSEPTTTTPKPTTTTPEPTTTTPEPTTTTPEPTTTTPEPTTTTPEPTTTTPEPTTTTPEPTTTTPEPTTTTPEPTTTTPEPTTTTPKPTTTTPEPTTTTQEPTTTTLKPTTTTPEHSTKTPEPTNTTPEPTTTTPEPTTSTPEPTTSTPKPTTTTPKPIPPTEIPELTTSTSETTTSIPMSSKQPNCMKSPEDVSVEYHSVSWISTNETNTTTIRTVHQPYINFKCMFVLRQDASIFYKIKWYVNNVTLVKTVTVSEADIDQATLSTKDLPPVNHTAGLQIQCTVSASKDPASTNCKSTDSPSFFAGIKVNETYHNILRKEKVAIQVYTTIPYVTKTVVVNGQPQPLPVLGIYPLLPPSTSSCKGSIGVDKCVIEFKAYSFNERHKYNSNDWRQRQTLVLYHVDSDGYEINQSLMVQLKARLDGDRFWSNFNQNILMTITDYNEYWKGKSCGSKTDPHMYTFDGVSYENHIDGEFILYRNRLYNQEVQTRHKQCHPDYNFPHCTCAVSVQSGQDVFLVDLCGDVQFVDFLSCNDSVIQVYKISDKLYKISLPTGSYVMVSLVEWPVQGSWQIDIDIYPSLSDVYNTVGLCGTLDGDRDNDFKRRNGDTDNVNLVYPDDFSNSWKVLGDENSLKEPLSTRQPISSTLDKICMCTSNGDQCLYNTLMHCSTTVEKQFLCTELTVQTSVSRKKRDLSGKWIPPSLSVPTPLTRYRRDVQFNTSTSRENAESVCTSAFESSGPYKTCQDYVSDLSNSSLSNCINDVFMTGDHNITAIHVEAALQQCVTFVGLNTTLQNANPVVTTSLQSLCPSNCSGHGVCNKGNCSCEVGFGGSDCSFDILSPPVIWESTPGGICDRSLHQCSRIYLKGRYFLENVDKICFFKKQSIRHNGSMSAFTQLESSLEEENLFRGSCSIPSDDVTSWVTKYMFNVSYDRKQFTQSFLFYTYQSECQQHSVENGLDYFTLKQEYCFINNTCVQLAAVNPENRCQECNPSRNNYQWSGIQDCESTTTLKPSALSTSTVVYIVTASVLVFLFVVAIVVVIGVWKYHRSRQYAESSEDENTEYRRDVAGKSWMRFFDDGKFPYIPRGSRYSAETYSSSKTERFY